MPSEKKCEKCLFWSGCSVLSDFLLIDLSWVGFGSGPNLFHARKHYISPICCWQKSSPSASIQHWGASNGCKRHLWKTCCCLQKRHGFATNVLQLLYRSKLKVVNFWKQVPCGGGSGYYRHLAMVLLDLILLSGRVCVYPVLVPKL